MKIERKPVLFFLKLPPPVTGATTINSLLLQNPLLENILFKIILSQHYKSTNRGISRPSLKHLGLILYYHLCLLKIIALQKFQFVYFQISPLRMAFLRDSLYVLLLKVCGKKMIFHMHGIGINSAMQTSRLLSALYKFIFKNSYLITLSKNVSYDYEALSPKKLFVLNNGITDQIKQYTFRPKSSSCSLLYFGYVDSSKGVIVLLDALQQLNYLNLDYTLDIYGVCKNISEKELYIHISSRNLLQNVFYHGEIFGDDKYEIYKKADLFVYPTMNDFFPLVILEAMQASLPIIATTTGSIPEILDYGNAGILVDPNNPDAISVNIRKLVQDYDLRIHYAKNARNRFEQYYTEAMFHKNSYDIFCEILNAN